MREQPFGRCDHAEPSRFQARFLRKEVGFRVLLKEWTVVGGGVMSSHRTLVGVSAEKVRAVRQHCFHTRGGYGQSCPGENRTSRLSRVCDT